MADLRQAAERLRGAGLATLAVADPAAMATTPQDVEAIVVQNALALNDMMAILREGRADNSAFAKVRTLIQCRYLRVTEWQRLFDAGAHDILPMPGDPQTFDQSVLAARAGRHPRDAIRAFLSAHRSSVGRLVRGEFEIRTLDEAERLSTMLATHCPKPEQAAIGIWELLSNAIEHGNLGIDFETKAVLLQQGRFHQEVADRLDSPVYGLRMARVEFRRAGEEIRLRVIDQGSGFDYLAFIARGAEAGKPNGRGIFLARNLCFDKLRYRGRGNIVEATIKM